MRPWRAAGESIAESIRKSNVTRQGWSKGNSSLRRAIIPMPRQQGVDEEEPDTGFESVSLWPCRPPPRQLRRLSVPRPPYWPVPCGTGQRLASRVLVQWG
jgi:hypothetical protein